MSERELDEVQRDALQEIANIGMGQAGAALARLLDTFVTLSVPDTQLIDVDALSRYLSVQQDVARVVRQSFQSDISGEAIVMFGQDGYRELRELMGYETEAAQYESEMLSDIASVLVGGCVQSVFEQLGCTLMFTAPTFLSLPALIEALGSEMHTRWEKALLLRVQFALEHGGFVAQLVMLLPDEAIISMKLALDEFLKSL
jgi:chemotaxis protein CheC